MLDQNTDRMWYVIGAVIVGAALILIMNGVFPSLFSSIGTTFNEKVADVSEVVRGIPPKSESGGGEMTDGIRPPVKGDGVNLLTNPQFDLDGVDNVLKFPYGEEVTVVKDGIYSSEVIHSNSWAKRLNKNVIIDKPGMYTYSIRARFETDVKEALWFRFDQAELLTKDTWYNEDANPEEGPEPVVVESIPGTDWKTYSVTFTVTEAGQKQLRLYVPFAEMGDKVWVDWEKLETGEVATPI